MREAPIEHRRKRLAFRAARRGFKEADAIFGTFAEMYLPELDEAALDLFEQLLEVPDREVYTWLTGETPVPVSYATPVFARLKALCNRKNPRWTA